MEKVQKNTEAHTLPLNPTAINDLIDTKEKVPVIPKKVKILPYVIMGLVISIVLAGIGMVVWKLVQSNKNPDLVVNAPSAIHPSSTPASLPAEGTTQLLSQDLLFEANPYRNELAKFEIKVPQGWSIDESGQSGAIVVLLDPKVTMASGSALLTFVSVSTGASGDTLEDEVIKSKDGLQKLFTSYTFEEDKDMTLGGNTYHLLGGSYYTHGTKMRNRNLILMYNDRGYAISSTAPESVWPKKELLLNAAIFSFKNF